MCVCDVCDVCACACLCADACVIALVYVRVCVMRLCMSVGLCVCAGVCVCVCVCVCVRVQACVLQNNPCCFDNSDTLVTDRNVSKQRGNGKNEPKPSSTSLHQQSVRLQPEIALLVL